MKNGEKLTGCTKEEIERYLADRMNEDGYIFYDEVAGYDPNIFNCYLGSVENLEFESALDLETANKEEC